MTITDQPWLQTLISIAVLLFLAILGNWIAKRVIHKVLERVLRGSAIEAAGATLEKVVLRLSNLVPALIVNAGIAAVPHLSETVVLLVQKLAAAFMILTVVRAIGAALGLTNELYMMRPGAGARPIKGYLQVAKLVIYCAGAILVIAALIDRSPVILLSGLGAMAAVLMLVFKDTILSLVASVQLGSNDMIRVGDWIEMPKYGADGDVIDVALHTVKIQNFDKTITTIPTHKMIEDSFRNWRGMSESGGRRIKRSLMIDQNSVRFLSAEEIDDLHRFAALRPYFEDKLKDIADWNAATPDRADQPVNTRRITNIGTLRAYIAAYLGQHARISSAHTMLVRQLAPGPEGLPIEIYAFASTVAWAEYEAIQADLFDHMIAILPEFGLRLFQQPTGLDFATLSPAAQPRELAAAG